MQLRTAKPELVDDMLPIGSAPVTYQITAVRSTARGNPAQYTVNFGIGGAAAGDWRLRASRRMRLSLMVGVGG